MNAISMKQELKRVAIFEQFSIRNIYKRELKADRDVVLSGSNLLSLMNSRRC